MPELTDTTENPAPWWFWLVAVVGVPFAALALFVGLCAASGWSDDGAWTGAAIAAGVGWAALIWLGERLRIHRVWTGVGVVLATAAAPAWLFGVIFVWVTIACPEAGCFN